MTIKTTPPEQLKNALEALAAEAPKNDAAFSQFQSQGLKLDMTRGKPSPEQLDLANGLLTVLGAADYKSASGTDCRNYGGVDGLPEAKSLFADFMGVTPAEVLIGDNASLSLMSETMVRALTHGVPGGASPWAAQGKTKFICPVPGYDRHFTPCAHNGIEMVNVAMNEDGPDMDAVEKLVADDPSIKGIWIVPRYSNPTGNVVSDAITTRLAKMKTAAADFRVFWDNAYAEHHLVSAPAPDKSAAGL